MTKYKTMIRRSEKDSEISLPPAPGIHVASVMHEFIGSSSNRYALNTKISPVSLALTQRSQNQLSQCGSDTLADFKDILQQGSSD
jgi:hypothetical protein